MTDENVQIEREGLEFSPEALLVRSDFYDGHNDINLYVEDAGSQYLYEEVFKRLLGDSHNIETIFPQGGKHSVIKAYEEKGRSAGGIRNVYVVDDDFDRLVCSQNMVDDPQFVYLHMYNIESCLISERGAWSLVRWLDNASGFMSLSTILWAQIRSTIPSRPPATCCRRGLQECCPTAYR